MSDGRGVVAVVCRWRESWSVAAGVAVCLSGHRIFIAIVCQCPSSCSLSMSYNVTHDNSVNTKLKTVI